MLVILLRNLSVPAGLVNGSRGIIVGFEEHSAEKDPLISTGRRSDYNFHSWALFGDHAAYQQIQLLNFNNRHPNACRPIAKFDNDITCTIRSHCEVEELGHIPERSPDQRFSLMSRTQIPLVAGWAITTHKSQGMTLEKAVVHLDGS